MEISQVRRQFSGVLVVFLLFLAGCSEPTQTTQPSYLTLTPTQLPEIIITRTPTFSSTPTDKVSLMPTETASPTPFPTSTPTPLPTLQPTEAFVAIRDFLSQGMDCPIPCFMGIIPGQSTFDQAVNILNSLRQPIYHSKEPEFYSYSYKYRGLSLLVQLEIEYELVKNIELSIGLVNYEGDPNLRAWRGFSPDILVNKYGPPSQVGFDLVVGPSQLGSPPENAEYNMVLYFKPLDLTVLYALGLTKEGNVLRICPLSDLYEGVRVYFGKDPVIRPDFRAPLEQVSSLNIQQFSELMIQTSKPACFEISKKAFSPPHNQ